jgi:hypothetical protein
MIAVPNFRGYISSGGYPNYTLFNVGYNLGHYLSGSNVSDWFRYSEVNAARMFISVSDIEPIDDIPPVGDNVTDLNSFNSRKTLLRQTGLANNTYVNWNYFISNYAAVTGIGGGNNNIDLNYALNDLYNKKIKLLVNMNASTSRFAISSDTDWGNMWELWQHFYASSFLLAKNYNVRNFSIYNEPDATSLSIPLWLVRLKVCSDAIQSAIHDVNTSYNKSLSANIYAPNTAGNASTNYTLSWGQSAVQNRHVKFDGTTDPDLFNFNYFNYQKYSSLTDTSGGSKGYRNDILDIRALIDADVTEYTYPLVLSEFNVRTSANYDNTANTLDTPFDYNSLASSCAVLATYGASELFLFKFGQTEKTGGNYPVVKNGTYYVSNSGLCNYGGATKGAEVYRLFAKARKVNKDTLYSSYVNNVCATFVTVNSAENCYNIYISNKSNKAAGMDNFYKNLAPNNSVQFITEYQVNSGFSGGVSRRLNYSDFQTLTIPPSTTSLIHIPRQTIYQNTIQAFESTVLKDGIYKSTTGSSSVLQVRSDGTADGRKVSLIKFTGINAYVSKNISKALLCLNATPTLSASNSFSPLTQVHVYGVTDNNWSASTATWNNLYNILKQNIPAGSQIQNNIINNQGDVNKIQGQIVSTDSYNGQYQEKIIDVTEFVKNSNNDVSFLISQDHRWDVKIPELTNGDIQDSGLTIISPSLIFNTLQQ